MWFLFDTLPAAVERKVLQYRPGSKAQQKGCGPFMHAPKLIGLAVATRAVGLLPRTGPYHPLNPQLQPQPSHVDIYPGLSGGLSISAEGWNSYVLQAPDNDMLQYLYDQGRRDAAAYVRTAFPGSTAEADAVLESTARDVNAIPIPSLIQAAVNTANAAALDPVGTISAVQTAGLSTISRVFG